jgi:polyisoprenoid-binding protein YceI
MTTGANNRGQEHLMDAASVAARSDLPTGIWHVDPAHSRVEFAIKQLGISTVRGAFREFEGTLDLDEGRAYGTVKTSSVDTNNHRRDEHLRSPDFLEVAEHPEMRFESTEIRPRGEGGFEIEGELTIRGATKPIMLRAELQGPETDPGGTERIALDVTGELDRSDWGMTNPLLARIARVSDNVKLRLEIAAVRQL